jgi:hypothetical protein
MSEELLKSVGIVVVGVIVAGFVLNMLGGSLLASAAAGFGVTQGSNG